MGGWRAAKTEVSQAFAVRLVPTPSEPTTPIITFSLFFRTSPPGTSSSVRTADLCKCFTPAGGATSDLRGFWRSLLSKTQKHENFSSSCESHCVDQNCYLSSKTAKPQSLQNEFDQGTREWRGVLFSQNESRLKSSAKATKSFPGVAQHYFYFESLGNHLNCYGQKRQILPVPPGGCGCEMSLQLFLIRLREPNEDINLIDH